VQQDISAAAGFPMRRMREADLRHGALARRRQLGWKVLLFSVLPTVRNEWKKHWQE
jgi:hypothetical protein